MIDLFEINKFFFKKKKQFFILESNTDEVQKLTCPDFSQYLYFLFAPTLIYCDKYPRNAVIHWDYVLQMFGQVLASIFYVYYVVVRFCVPTFANLNQNQITLPIFLSVLFNSIMPGSLFLLLGFYGFLHCWLNAFAEMLRFADRMFYKVQKKNTFLPPKKK
jgi:sterol O-acyltransferase